MANIRETLENAGVEESKIADLVTQLSKKQEVINVHKVDNTLSTMNNLDMAIMQEKDPIKKSALIAQKISFKIDNDSYYS